MPERRPATFASRTLWNIGWRYLLRHPWQSALMVLGITLGVAVAVAVDLANASATRAFDYSTDAVAGRATHQIVGRAAGAGRRRSTSTLRRQGLATGGIPGRPDRHRLCLFAAARRPALPTAGRRSLCRSALPQLSLGRRRGARWRTDRPAHPAGRGPAGRRTLPPTMAWRRATA